MAEPLSEQILAKAAQAFGTIVADGGATYWYKPTLIKRLDFLDESEFDVAYEVQYIIRPGDEKPERMATQNYFRCELEFFVTVARQDKGGQRAGGSPTLRETIQRRLTADAIRALLKDDAAGWTTWGMGLTGLSVTDVDYEPKLERWVLAHLRFEARYHERKA